MTDAQRHAAILALIERYTEKHTVSREAARQALIKQGIYTSKGELRREYGGPAKKAKPVR